ncbi:zinc fingers and homeoboxes protein 1 [Paramormyrops kingsleyae]|uniref:zinc fingers and homeoboxes protein 1 n=1 Tax=Paramormyrops kingsleyae TaxID=1676925 RepID=UPI000CD625B7|nr:zinc fingers and homeoboxes protein 1 [Paramormyrops kingsleyae]XP_023669050.1 zinc fingers and homeoboxes protein 1 [Paramormyrops kingsleyae]
MASRRKSTTPCMVVPLDTAEQDPDVETTDKREGPDSVTEVAVEGSAAPVKSDPEHSVRHLGEDGFARSTAKRSTHTASEPGLADLASVHPESEEAEDAAITGISLSKTPIMKMKSKGEPKRIAVPHKGADENGARGESEGEQEPKEGVVSNPIEALTPLPVEAVKPSVVITNPNTILPEPKKTIISSATVLPAGLAQVLSALQAQQNAQTQLLIPVSSIPAYNSTMDTNPLLVNTYNKFPYPTVSEIMTLAAQTKYAEEQIKIWFSAQRLKHGVSWTPEEVEEARRKQFNGTVHTVPQTITVIPAHLSSTHNGLQSILQTCQIVGQPGLVLTQVGSAGNLPVTTPITLTVAGVPSQTQLPKPATIQATPATVETKRATTVQPPSLTPQENSALTADHFGMRPKKSKEQLAELKASYLKNHFASDAEISRLMKLTNLTKGEIKKWFSDTRYNQRNSKNNHVIVFNENTNSANNNATIVIDSSDETTESPTSGPVKEKETRNKSWNPFPDFTLQKFKEKTPEQLLVLEESYQKCSTPNDEELSRLRSETKLTRREINAWFTEKRKAPADSTDQKKEQADAEAVTSLPSPKSGSQTPPSSRRWGKDKIGKKTPEQLHILKNAFVRTQWPTAEEYDKLAEESGLPRTYIVNWFGDSRYAWKNGNLKWYYYYQSGNVEPMNGSGHRKRGRGRNRNRGWSRSRSRRAKRASGLGKSSPPIKFKTGKEILKEYYLKHKFLNEQDLDELVAKTNMGYEQVRDWFAEIKRREDLGMDPFDGGAENGELAEGEESQEESEMAAEEQGEVIRGEDDNDDNDDDDDSDDSDAWEPPQSVRRTLSGSED